MSNELQQILQRLEAIEKSLSYGFQQGGVTTVFAAYSDVTNSWYCLDKDSQQIPAPSNTVIGIPVRLDTDQKEYKGKIQTKLLLHLDCGNSRIIIRSGGGEDGLTLFSQGVVSSISALRVEQLRQPIRLTAKPGTEGNVLFCNIEQRVEGRWQWVKGEYGAHSLATAQQLLAQAHPHAQKRDQQQEPNSFAPTLQQESASPAESLYNELMAALKTAPHNHYVGQLRGWWHDNSRILGNSNWKAMGDRALADAEKRLQHESIRRPALAVAAVGVESNPSQGGRNDRRMTARLLFERDNEIRQLLREL